MMTLKLPLQVLQIKRTAKELQFPNRVSSHLSALALATSFLWQLAPISDSNQQNQNKTKRVLQNEGGKTYQHYTKKLFVHLCTQGCVHVCASYDILKE